MGRDKGVSRGSSRVNSDIAARDLIVQQRRDFVMMMRADGGCIEGSGRMIVAGRPRLLDPFQSMFSHIDA